MLSCREITHHADQLLDHDLRLSTRIAVQVHLLICRHCRRYIKQLRRLVAAIPFMHNQATEEEVRAIMDHLHSQKNI